MTERGILFSAPMVRALLAGTKTQTRRLVRDQSVPGRTLTGFRQHHGREHGYEPRTCPYGARGDRLWVRETWRITDDIAGRDVMEYRAGGTRMVVDGPAIAHGEHQITSVAVPWRPSIFMPRWASRITLRVTAVRVERLQDISEDDAKAEGVVAGEPMPALVNGKRGEVRAFTHRDQYALLWNAINGKRAPWASNPWVWVVMFEVQP